MKVSAGEDFNWMKRYRFCHRVGSELGIYLLAFPSLVVQNPPDDENYATNNHKCSFTVILTSNTTQRNSKKHYTRTFVYYLFLKSNWKNGYTTVYLKTNYAPYCR